jgi:hypothetical protein
MFNEMKDTQGLVKYSSFIREPDIVIQFNLRRQV